MQHLQQQYTTWIYAYPVHHTDSMQLQKIVIKRLQICLPHRTITCSQAILKLLNDRPLQIETQQNWKQLCQAVDKKTLALQQSADASTAVTPCADNVLRQVLSEKNQLLRIS